MRARTQTRFCNRISLMPSFLASMRLRFNAALTVRNSHVDERVYRHELTQPRWHELLRRP